MTQWRTIPEMAQNVTDRFGDAEAVVDGALRLSFAEVVEHVRTAAGAFAEFGVGKGDWVALWAPNSAEWIIAAFGLMTAGAVLVPVNTRFKTDEAVDVVARSGAKAVLVQKASWDRISISQASRRPICRRTSSVAVRYSSVRSTPMISRMSSTPPAWPAAPRAP